MLKRLSTNQFHDSMRGYFAGHLYNQMIENKDIYVISGDLGYGLWDKVRDDFPDRFYNIGAAEQAGAGVCIGLALSGKKPFFFSITTFALYRPFEMWRLYASHERIPVRIIGSGRDQDYEHDGISHWSMDAKQILSTLPRIKQYWPNEKEEIAGVVEKMVNIQEPSFISLRR